MAIFSHGRLGASWHLKVSFGCPTVNFYHVSHASTSCRISDDMPGQTLARRKHDAAPMCAECTFCFISSCKLVGITTRSPLKIRSCSTVISSLTLKYGRTCEGGDFLSSGQLRWITAFDACAASSRLASALISSIRGFEIGRLNWPEKAAISRKLKVQTNLAEKKRNDRGTADSNVSAWDRLNQFKGEHLIVVSGKLTCDACKETVCKKKSSVSKHIASQKHIK